jgi:hypothetical protein
MALVSSPTGVSAQADQYACVRKVKDRVLLVIAMMGALDFVKLHVFGAFAFFGRRSKMAGPCGNVQVPFENVHPVVSRCLMKQVLLGPPPGKSKKRNQGSPARRRSEGRQQGTAVPRVKAQGERLYRFLIAFNRSQASAAWHGVIITPTAPDAAHARVVHLGEARLFLEQAPSF